MHEDGLSSALENSEASTVQHPDPSVLATAAETAPSRTVQLRLVVEAEQFEEAVQFYRDGLGLSEEFDIESDGGARVVALQVGRATLEIVNPEQRRLIDRLEVGREVSRSIRVAFEVTDVDVSTERLVSAGAELLAPPTETPWRSLNARFEAPAGLQITLFQELGDSQQQQDAEDRGRPDRARE